MAGSLIKIDEFTISSGVSSVIIGGGSGGSSGLNVSIDSTYDVYILNFNNVKGDADTAQARFRVTTSGSADTSSNYDRAHKIPRTAGQFAKVYTTNGTYWIYNEIGTATGEQLNGIMYLYNFNKAGEYCYYTLETAERISSGELQGVAGGGVHTVTQACDGIQMFASSGNLTSGTFTLYGLKK
tara:strand:+ start:1277 stop:1825 length:549 start_codon:yes stop_codon:yes gene_type:complete